jgi:aminoglycoside phosphotransferase family enzyme/predicted kinase
MTIPEQQRDVAAFLQQETGSVPVETHISAVFAGGQDVYKLKKAVKLSFLDFTSVESRAAMVRRELELNGIAAPEIYRGVSAIIRGNDNALHFAPAETPHALDYVVRMAPIQKHDFLDEIVKCNRLAPSLADALGDCIADLHARLPVIQNWDSPGGMRHIIDGNAGAARAANLPSRPISNWHAAILAEFDRIAPVLTARAATGYVRRLHGDLHLGNICLWHGKPTAFDMLEFDEALATADVAYDLAFLLMDLEFHAGRAAANRVMNRYIARTGDVGLLAALPCFMSVRALVRAHVQASRQDHREAALYLHTATESLRAVMPVLVTIGGLPGTGKTTLGRGIAPGLGRAPGAVLLRSDETRKRLFHALPEQKLGPDAYTNGANARVNSSLLADTAQALQAGQAVVVDSTFLHPPLRQGIEDAARHAHAPFHGFWLEAPLETLLQRVADRRNGASDAGPDVVRKAAASDAGHITWKRVQSEDTEAALQTICVELPVQNRSAATFAKRQMEKQQRSPGDAGDNG